MFLRHHLAALTGSKKFRFQSLFPLAALRVLVIGKADVLKGKETPKSVRNKSKVAADRTVMHEFTRHCLQPAEKRCSLPPFILGLLTTGCCQRKESKQARDSDRPKPEQKGAV